MLILKQHPAATMFKDDAGFLHVRETSDFASVPFDSDYNAALKYFDRCVKRFVKGTQK